MVLRTKENHHWQIQSIAMIQKMTLWQIPIPSSETINQKIECLLRGSIYVVRQ